MEKDHYCLRWNNYQSNMTSVFHQLLETEAFVDVTLACDTLSLKAHKVVLSACSAYFQKLLLENPCEHPTIIMPQDVDFGDLRSIIDFVYKGEIDVTRDELQSLLRTADQLKIKGLCDSDEKRTATSTVPPLVSSELYRKSSPTHPEDNNRKYKYRRLNRKGRGPPYDNKNKPGLENDMPVEGRGLPLPEQETPLNMSSHGMTLFSQFDAEDFPPEPPAPSAIPVGHLDMSDHSPTMLTNTPIHRTDLSDATTKYTMEIKKEADVKFETLRSFDQDSLLEMDSHMSGDHSIGSHEDLDLQHHHMDYGVGMRPGMSNRLGIGNAGDTKDNGHGDNVHQMTPRSHTGGGPKTWTQEDMDMALDALKNHNMSLTKASATYGIPSTTLWQRAHRLGIDTPKKEGPTKSWTEENLNNALEALRTGTISANKASKAYGIPSSTLYKIARREGIRLAAPFNAAPTTWTPEDLEKALESIRTGQTSVQKASTEFGIPTGTLYGRCKREGIELSRSNPTPWSEDAMGEALEAVRRRSTTTCPIRRCTAASRGASSTTRTT
ncbi:protein tramtrack, beta isoform-like isoform X2 [Cylas formicarius]|uniref:protein tramtrack, beta isoform-like isoform X2 n=1 Tax=Cylas formicarius TaxID=197179 RepID=UPI0029587560|nr:protein tramtrack, beta isoform-like isoform X2 [Cylas formicarius]